MAKKKPKSGAKKKQANASSYRNDSIKDQLAGLSAIAEGPAPAPNKENPPEREEEAVEAEPSEEDLFRAAVADIDASAAILEKYDVVSTKTPTEPHASKQRQPPAEDAESEDFDPTDSRLFLDAVEGVNATSHKKAKS